MYHLVLGDENVLGDVDKELLLLEHLNAVFWHHLCEALLGEGRQIGLQHPSATILEPYFRTCMARLLSPECICRNASPFPGSRM